MPEGVTPDLEGINSRTYGCREDFFSGQCRDSGAKNQEKGHDISRDGHNQH